MKPAGLASVDSGVMCNDQALSDTIKGRQRLWSPLDKPCGLGLHDGTWCMGHTALSNTSEHKLTSILRDQALDYAKASVPVCVHMQLRRLALTNRTPRNNCNRTGQWECNEGRQSPDTSLWPSGKERHGCNCIHIRPAGQGMHQACATYVAHNTSPAGSCSHIMTSVEVCFQITCTHSTITVVGWLLQDVQCTGKAFKGWMPPSFPNMTSQT